MPEVNDLLNLFHRCMAVSWSTNCRSTCREINDSLSSHHSPQEPKCSGDESSSDKWAPRLSTRRNLESFYLSPGQSRTFCWLPCVGTRTAALHQSLCWADPLRFPGKRLLRKTKTVACYKLDSMSRWSRTVVFSTSPTYSKGSWAWVGGIISFFIFEPILQLC